MSRNAHPCRSVLGSATRLNPSDGRVLRGALGESGIDIELSAL